MYKKLLKSSWILGVSIVIIGIASALLINIFVDILNSRKYILPVLYLLGANIIGFIYTRTFREIINSKLRLKSTLIFCLLDFILYLTLLYPKLIHLVDLSEPYFYLSWLLLVFIIVVSGSLVYLSISDGGKLYLYLISKRNK